MKRGVKMLTINFYDKLDFLRFKKKTTWRKIADDLDISPSTFTRLKLGKLPTVETFLKIIRWGNMNFDDFMKVIH